MEVEYTLTHEFGNKIAYGSYADIIRIVTGLRAYGAKMHHLHVEDHFGKSHDIADFIDYEFIKSENYKRIEIELD